MYITGLKREKKRLTAVFVDGELWDKLDSEVLEQRAIKAGMQVDEDFLTELKFESDYKRAKDRAMYLISFRDYSEKELFSKLKRDYDEAAVKKAVARMRDVGLINDLNFAQKYAKELLFNKHFSKRRAEFELLQKGIDKDTVCDILAELEYDAVEQIRLLVDKKYRLAYSDEKVKKRAVAFLQRYGYRWNDIKRFFDSYYD